MLKFQRGLLLAGFGAGRADCLEEGLGAVAEDVLTDAGEGCVLRPVLGIDDLRPVSGCGIPECLHDLEKVFLAVELPTELPRLLEVPKGVDEPFKAPAELMITDEAGELPGVSTALAVTGLSIEIILEMESRSCCD